MLIAGGLAAGLGLLLLGCSPLLTFNAIMPKDGASARIAQDVPYGAGPRRQLDIYAPRARAANPRPVIVFFYGGSWASGTRAGYGFVGRALAARGFLTIIPDYRLVPEVTYPGFVEDGAAAVRWAEAHAGDYGGDPRRIILAGHSAGAYIAAMLALDERWLGADRKAVRGFVGLAGPYDFLPFAVPASKAAFGAWPHPEETQPIHWASAAEPPVLLLYGDKDTIVEPRNSIALAARLRSFQSPAQIKAYPGVGHIGLITAVALPLRGKAPVVDDIAAFAAAVSRD